MGLASSISPQLPFLRRFSRALAGSQQSGDAFVASLLESLIADSSELQKQPDSRVALYRLFCRLWQTASITGGLASGPDWERSAQRQLAGIQPKARQAFLLKAIEGFGEAEIAAILDETPARVAALLKEAANTIVDQVATDVLIIEDEPIIAMDLEAILESLGHRVTGIARTAGEAMRLASAKRPGLMLVDIQLADGSSGIDAANQILRMAEIPVIFITAFPERLLTGERPEPAFLITKPFGPDMVKAVVSQALFFESNSRAAA